MTDRSVDGAARYLFEILLSGTIAAALLTDIINSNERYWSSWIFALGMGLNDLRHRGVHDAMGQTLAFYIWCLPPGIVIFLSLRILRRVSLVKWTLRTAAGVVVVAVPLICLWLVGFYRPVDLYRGWAWLRFEGCGAVGCAVLYAYNRWPAPVWTAVALLTLHSALWVHAYSKTFAYLGSRWSTVPVIAYLSTLAWGYYVQRWREQQTAQLSDEAA